MGEEITPASAGLSAALQQDLNVAKANGRGLKTVATEMGKSYSWAAEMVHAKQPFPLAKLDVWVRVTGGRHLARWVADTCGCDLVEREEDNAEATALEAMGESAEALQAASSALQDGVVTPEELAIYQREMQGAIEKFHGLDLALQSRMKRRRPARGAGSMAEAEARKTKS